MRNKKGNCSGHETSCVEEERFAKLLNNQDEDGTISIEIDKITPCLEELKTGRIVDTQYNKISISKALAKQLKTEKWKFDWGETEDEVYQLTLSSNRLIQGLISLGDRKTHIYVELVESSPKNIGKSKIYNGVGSHLFAIAAEKSFEAGHEGYVSFKPKTALKEYYEYKLGAVMMPNGDMQLDTYASSALIEKYTKKEENHGG